MKQSLAVALLLALAPAAQATEAEAPSAPGQVCVTPVTPQPPAKFVVVKQIKLSKGGYGSVEDAIALLADKARKMGADAVINYTGSQRFGFWPWRFVHPVVRGTAIKWQPDSTFDCTASGGWLH